MGSSGGSSYLTGGNGERCRCAGVAQLLGAGFDPALVVTGANLTGLTVAAEDASEAGLTGLFHYFF